MNKLDEIKKINRVADMLITAHSKLRDKYSCLSQLLDLLIIFVSIGLNAFVFVKDENILFILSPLNIPPNLMLGSLTLIIFILSMMHYIIDWKGKSVAHSKSCEVYLSVKRNSSYLLSLQRDITDIELEKLYDNNNKASELSTVIPEKSFLRLKKHHLTKVLLSKHLDDHPDTIIWLHKLKNIFNENF